ncbi:MAG: hypothetical protein ACK52U_09535 [Synechococcaceae cyanobacterium]
MARANAATPISRRPTACQRPGLSADPPALLLALLASGLAPLPAAQAEVIKAAEPVPSATDPAAGQAAAAAAAGAAAAKASLALPGCRAALGLEGHAPVERLLANDPALAAKLALIPACKAPSDSLSRLERLEGELAASRKRIADQQAQLAAETSRQDALARDLAELRRQLLGGAGPGARAGATAVATPAPATSAAANAPAAAPPVSPVASPAASPAHAPAPAATPAVAYSPGRGFSFRAGESLLTFKADARLLGFSSSRYVFNPGQPLVVSPKSPDTTYDLSAQQSTVAVAFQGPKWRGWTPGAYGLFTLQDNILAEGYSFTPVVVYGELQRGGWRIAAGQNFDVFAPRDPDNLPSGKLAATGNPGAYRPQIRVERSLGGGAGFGGSLQLALSSPITTALPKDLDLANLETQELVEDNGWPNLEARLNLGFGALRERAGGRNLRPFELGFSGVVGQLRVLDNIRPTDPLTLAFDRSTVDVWGAAVDGQLALGRRFGLSGEFYTGQGLGQYMAGIFQSYNRRTNQPVPTTGGWVQAYVYLADNLRFNLGYGVDNAWDAGALSLTLNSAAFANVVWDVNPWLQLGLEGNYRFTTYEAFGDKDAWVVITEVMFRL